MADGAARADGLVHNYFDGDVAEPTTRARPRCSHRRCSGRPSTSWPASPRGRPALELAIGTGRVALPLSERGVTVSGIEFSQAMADRLQAKPAAPTGST